MKQPGTPSPDFPKLHRLFDEWHDLNVLAQDVVEGRRFRWHGAGHAMRITNEGYGDAV